MFIVVVLVYYKFVIFVSYFAELVKLFVNQSMYNKVLADDWLKYNDSASLQIFGECC